jgi:hypothetical protein
MLRKHKTPNGIALQFLQKIAAEYDGSQCLMWPYGAGHDGYGLIDIGGKKRRVPRIICEIENGPAPEPGMDAAHSCGNGHLGCIARKHLRWATRKENVADARAHGTFARGETNGHSKLTESDVLDIRMMRGKVRVSRLAEKYGVSPSTISAVQYGTTWGSVTGAPLAVRKDKAKTQE